MAEIRRADPTARRQALALVVLGAILGIVLLCAFELYREPLLGWLRAQPSRVSVIFLLLAGMLSVPLFALAAYLWFLGAKVERSELFPPAGLRMVRDTTVITGTAAVRRGRVLKVLAVALVFVAGLLCVVLWSLTKAFKGLAA